MTRNEQAAALRRRAGNAGTAIAVDTRPKVARPKHGKGGYDRKAQKRHDRAERRFDADQAAARRPFSSVAGRSRRTSARADAWTSAATRLA